MTETSYMDRAAEAPSSAPVLPQGSAMLARIEAIVPEIAARAQEIERNGRLPADIIAKLEDAGLFRMMLPTSLGGEGLNLLQACRVIEAISKADGSAGWNAMVCFGFNAALARFPKATVQALLANGPDVRFRGAMAPLGKYTRSDEGLTISGRWPFASGSYEAQWVAVGAILPGADGKPLIGPDQRPVIGVAIIPAAQAEFLDNWDVVGMEGSSSEDFTVKDVGVTEDYIAPVFDFNRPSSIDAPWLSIPFVGLTAPTHSAVVLGLAQGALDEVTALSATKRSAFDPTMRLADDPVFQSRLGEAAAKIYALRAGMDRSIMDYAGFVEAGQPVPIADIMRCGALVTYTHHQCLEVINDLFSLAGSTPVYNSSALQRRWRDARVAAQHVSAGLVNFSRYGAMLANPPHHC